MRAAPALALTFLLAACGSGPAPAPLVLPSATQADDPCRGGLCDAPTPETSPPTASPVVASPRAVALTGAKPPAPARRPPAPVRSRTQRPVTHRPTPPPAPTGGGPFLCRDGWISHAKHRQGACSHHGGIA